MAKKKIVTGLGYNGKPSLATSEPPEGVGQRLQWETNKRRMALGLKPFPGPRPIRKIRIVRKKKNG